MPGLHAISGADNTCSFAGKEKLAFWKAFKEASDDEVLALGKLGTTPSPVTSFLLGSKKFICKLYLLGTKITTVWKLRWLLFTKRQM